MARANSSRAEAIQDRTKKLLIRAEEAVLSVIHAVDAAKKSGATDEQLKAARDLHRQSQWRLDFVAAENSLGFHAPQESARILAEAIDLGRQGEVAALRDKRLVPAILQIALGAQSLQSQPVGLFFPMPA